MTRAAQRVFSVAFKEAAVRRIVAGESVAFVARGLGVLRKDLYRWRALFLSTGAVGLPRGRPRNAEPRTAGPVPPDEMSQARLRIAELERKVGQQQVDLDFFQRALRHVGAPPRATGKPSVTPSTSKSGR